MKRFILTCTALFFFFSAQLYAGGSKENTGKSGTKATLRMGLITAENNPVTKASRKFADLVKERTKGQYEIQVNSGGSLGGEVEMHDMIASGSLDLGCFGSGIPASYNPEFQILLMPFLWNSADQMITFSKSKIQEEMNEKYTTKSKVRILSSNWFMGLRQVISKKPIATVEDFKGLKIRVPELPAWVDMFKQLGAIPMALPFPEVYTALQQGVVDAAENPLNLILSNSHHEAAKTIVLTSHVMYFNLVFMNDKLFTSLSPEVQKIMKDSSREAGDYETQINMSEDSEVRTKLEKAGVKFVTVDIPKLSKTMTPLYDKWEKTYGSEIRKKIDTFKNEHP